jgi:SAM-dependent methyltransferase
MGRWSRPVAARFVEWLAVPASRRWLDVGCGTGALTGVVLDAADPAEVLAVDQSGSFLATARARIHDPRATFQQADARSVPVPDDRFDAVVSGLVLNFVPEPADAVMEWARAAAPGAVVAAYVWDYSEGMRLMREFWDAATAIDPATADLDELRRFPMCRPDPLRDLWSGAGLADVSVAAIDVRTVFRDFDDYWRPFLGGQGPAPSYLMSRDEQHRDRIRGLLARRLPMAPDGSIPLTARAWAVRGRVAERV